MFVYRANATTEEGAEQNPKTINQRSDCTWKTRKAIGKTDNKWMCISALDHNHYTKTLDHELVLVQLNVY